MTNESNYQLANKLHKPIIKKRKKEKYILHLKKIDTENFALKTNLSSLKTGIDKVNIDKFVLIPNDLSKLHNAVKNEVVKKTEYNKLVTKVNNIDTSEFVLKTNYNTKITELENKIPTKTALTTVENKIPSISNLATKAALTTVENKIPNINNLATKTELTTVKK